MLLSDYLLEKIEDPKFVTVCGGGGKTSLLQLLGNAYKNVGKKVLLTTTTKFQSPSFYNWKIDRYSNCDQALLYLKIDKPEVFLFGNEYEKDERKWQSPDIEILEQAKEKFDVCICESDGARMLPVKVHTDRDPVVPDFTTYKISVMGILAIGKEKKDVVFGTDEEGVVDKEFLERYIKDSQGLLKCGADLVLVNGAETCSEQELEIVRNLHWPNGLRVVAASILQNKIVEIIR